MKKVLTVSAVATLATAMFALGGVSTAASASEGSTAQHDTSKTQCLVTPKKTSTVHHKAVYKTVDVKHEGKEAQTHDEQRFKQEYPAVEAVTHEEGQYRQDIPAEAEESYEHWHYSVLVPGLDETSHEEYLHKRSVPAVEEVSHEERQFSRTNPGSAEKSHKEYQFFRDVNGSKEVSHKEYKYSQSSTEDRVKTRVKRPDNTVEQKSTQGYHVVSGGTVRVKNVTIPGHWEKTNDSQYYAIPDAIINAYWGAGGVPASYLGNGSVNLSTYGGPNVTVKYQAKLVTITGGYTDWSLWSDWTTSNPGASNDTRSVESRSVTSDYKDGAWTTDTPSAPWVKTDERTVVDQPKTDGYREYRTADGSASKKLADAAWFKDEAFNGWSQLGSKKVVDAEKVNPFTEYRTADGTPSTKVADAAWFKESSFEGWEAFGDTKKVVDTAAVPGYTQYRTADGSASRTESDAAWSKDQAIDGWNVFDTKRVVDQQETADVTYYLVEGDDGSVTRSTN